MQEHLTANAPEPFYRHNATDGQPPHQIHFTITEATPTGCPTHAAVAVFVVLSRVSSDTKINVRKPSGMVTMPGWLNGVYPG